MGKFWNIPQTSVWNIPPVNRFIGKMIEGGCEQTEDERGFSLCEHMIVKRVASGTGRMIQ